MMYFIRVYTAEEELPEDIKKVEWSRDDWDHVIFPNSTTEKEIDFAETIAEKMAKCEYHHHVTADGLSFFVTYHA